MLNYELRTLFTFEINIGERNEEGIEKLLSSTIPVWKDEKGVILGEIRSPEEAYDGFDLDNRIATTYIPYFSTVSAKDEDDLGDKITDILSKHTYPTWIVDGATIGHVTEMSYELEPADPDTGDMDDDS